MDETTGRDRIALQVMAARVRRGWSKEKAAREAGVSSITWKRVEDGLPVQDVKLAAIAKALQLPIAGNQPNLLLLTAAENAAVNRRVHSHSDPDGSPLPDAADSLRAIAERNIAELLQKGEEEAATLAPNDPEAAARLLVDIAWVTQELRLSVERTINAMATTREAHYESDADLSDAIAARDIGKRSAGQRRRDIAEDAGEPPIDDPDDLEPR